MDLNTFEGFYGVSKQDGNYEYNKLGAFNVTKDYDEYLNQFLRSHENECPLRHIEKNVLIKGDATKTLKTI